MPNSRIPSPARSQGPPVTPRRYKTRATRSVGSPARSTASGRLSSIVDQFKDNNRDSFAVSPLTKTVLSDNTEIEMPRRQSWWRKVENSRDVLEVLENEKPADPANVLEMFGMEVMSQEKTNYSIDLPESSDNETINSIVLPQRKLFTQKENQPQMKFQDVVGTSIENKTQVEDKTINVERKNLFSKTSRPKPVFPAALLKTPDKTIPNKTTESLVEKAQRKGLFKRPGTKRKNMFPDFFASESEDDIPEIMPKRFTFHKPSEPSRRSSNASSATTDIDVDDWKMLPSSTMVENQLDAQLTTPGKRLSKLSEAKESTNTDSTKQSNKSISSKNKLLSPAKNQDAEKSVRKSKSLEKEATFQKFNDTQNRSETFNKTKNTSQAKDIPTVGNEAKETSNIKNKTYNINRTIGNQIANTSEKADVAATEHAMQIEEQIPELAQLSDHEDKVMDNSGQEKEASKNNLGASDQEKSKVCQEMSISKQAEVVDQEDVIDDNDQEKEASEDQIEASVQAKAEACQKMSTQELAQVSGQEDEEMDDNDPEKESNEDQIEASDQDKAEACQDMETSDQEGTEAEQELEEDEEEEQEHEEEEEHEEEIEESENEEEKEVNQEENNDEIDAEEQNASQEMEEDQEDEQVDDIQNYDQEAEADDEVIQESDDGHQNESLEVEEEAQSESEDQSEAQDESQEIVEEDEDEQHDSQKISEDDEQNEKQESEDEVENDDNQEVEEEMIDANEEMQDDLAESEQHETEPHKSETTDGNVTHDTTGRNRKKRETNTPEAVLNDSDNEMVSFTAKGRNTSIRKTLLKKLSIRPSMAPARESTGLSDGKKLSISPSMASARENTGLSDGTENSSAAGSGWDSHRTTRKTLRQTFGKDFSPRKSLRALVMEKSAQRQTVINEANAVLVHQANSTELPDDQDEMDYEDNVEPESDHEVSRRTRQTTLEMCLQKMNEKDMEMKQKIAQRLKTSVESNPVRFNTFNLERNMPSIRRINTKSSLQTAPKGKGKKRSFINVENLPPELVAEMNYKPPKRFKPPNASWATKRLYKFLETKLEPKYDYKARVRAEKLVETIYTFVRDTKRLKVAPPHSVNELKHEMARLGVVDTHFDFFHFFGEYLPLEVKIKVVPDIINELPVPPDVFGPIIKS